MHPIATSCSSPGRGAAEETFKKSIMLSQGISPPALPQRFHGDSYGTWLWREGSRETRTISGRYVAQHLALSVYSISSMYPQQPHVLSMLVKSTQFKCKFIKRLTDRNTCRFAS